MSGGATGWKVFGDRRVVAAAAGAAAVLLLGGSGLAVASAASHPEPASAGRLLAFDYVLARGPSYTPPPPTEATRLDVRPPAALYVPAVTPAADAIWLATQADDARRMAAALAEVRAADRRFDREMAAQLREAQAPVQQAEEDSEEAPVDEG